MKILFVFFGNKRACTPPLGVLTLATILKKNNYDVSVTDSSLFRNNKDLHDHVLSVQPDVLGLSVISMSYEDADELAEFVKEQIKDCKIVIGGPHATALPTLVAQNKNIDIVSIGESDVTVLEIMRAIKDGRSNFDDINGIAYRDKDGGEIVITEKREVVADLDTIPIPDRSFLPMEKYLSRVPDVPFEFSATSIMATRGCYGNCMYCQPLLKKIFGTNIRRRSPALVVEEIEYLLKTYRVKSLWFVDDEPTWNGEEWMAEICRLIIDKKIKFTWCAAARVDQISDKLLSDMKKAGCICFMFGVESGSESILKIMRKGYRPPKIKEAMDMCRRHKMISRAQLMVGTPGETTETLNETLDMINEARPDLIGVSITTPTPGSDLYEQFKDSERLQVKSWKDFDRFVINPIKLENITPDDLRATIKNFYRAHFKYHFLTFVNPILFIKRFYFVKAIFWHFASQLKSPKTLLSDIGYYLFYSRMRSSAREAAPSESKSA